MAALKPILRSNFVLRVVCWLGALYIRFAWLTGRWRVIGGETSRGFWERGDPFILAFWHGRLLMMPYCWNAAHPIHMLISAHRDGQIISRTVAHFGIDTIVGSTKRGGTGALRAMIGALAAGECVGITPDGPQGPRMRASIGVVNVARLTQVPIVPVSYGASPRRLVSSWDRFVVAFPFGRGVIVWGDPITIPRDADEDEIERSRRKVEDELNRITDEADRLCDVAPVAPAAPPESAAEAAS